MRLIQSLKVLLMSSLILAATSVSAQDDAEQSAAVDDATLQQFTAAFMEINSIQQEYSTSIGEAEDQAEAQELQQEAQTEMAEAVQSSGLEISTYNSIAQQLQSDTELQERVRAMLQ